LFFGLVSGNEQQPFSEFVIFPVMPLYYFDIHDGENFAPAEEGQSFPDAATAQRAAVREATCLIRELGKDRVTIIVRDESGNTLAEAEAVLRVSVKSDRHV
jgi:hypothetical protein